MFYGWIIVAGAFLSQFFMTGFLTYSFGLLVVPIQTEFGASRAELMYGMTGSTICGLFFAPVLGALVDRWSVRALMSIGAIVFASGLMLLSISHNAYQFAVVFAVSMSIGSLLLGPLTCSTVVSRWFTASRGKALGIAAIGTSIGGMVVPSAFEYWISSAGWRDSLQNAALCTLVVVLPFILLFMRGHPQDKGLLPEVSNENMNASAQTVGKDWGTKDILRSSSFWLIGFSIGLLFMAYAAVLSNLPAYAAGLGVTDAQASRLIMLVAIFGLIGKLIFGFAADKVSLRLGLWAALGLAGTAIAILSAEPVYLWIALAAIMLGLAAGGMLPVWGAMLAAVFGTLSYGRVMGLMSPLISILVMPGFLIAATVFDKYGSYSASLVLFAGLLLVSSCLLVPLKIPK
ncbi:MAG: MFS transporter [Pseudomonadales bacterium]